MPSAAPLELQWVEGSYSICRLPPRSLLVSMPGGPFVSITRTSEELSVVCREDEAPSGGRRQGPYALFRVAGSMDLDLTGIVAALTAPLAEAEVPVFAIATFDTDYVLVRESDREAAERALLDAGFTFVTAGGEADAN